MKRTLAAVALLASSLLAGAAAAQGIGSEHVDCRRDSLGHVRCSNGETGSTDALGTTRLSDGTSVRIDDFGNTHFLTGPAAGPDRFRGVTSLHDGTVCRTDALGRSSCD